MCVAVPMKIIEILNENTAVVDLSGVRYVADVSLIDTPNIGDHVIVHAGYAIETLDEEEALERMKLFEKLAALMESNQ